MKCWRIQSGELIQTTDYAPRRRDGLFVRIRAAGINRADLLQTMGRYDPPAGESDIPGLEIAGEIAEVGPGGGAWRIGDRICALLGSGGFADGVWIPAEMALPVPVHLSMEEAASLPEAIYTAYFNIVDRAQLTNPGTILIHAGASGIGTLAIQLAKHLGHRVACTVGTPAKAELCRTLGAEIAILYKESSFADEIARWNGRVDAILDCVGGTHFADNIRCLSFGGTLILIGLLGGGTSEIDLNAVLTKNIRILGTTLRPQPLAKKIELTQSIRQELWPLVEDGHLRPILDRVFPFDDAPAALAYLKTNQSAGKVVLTI